MNSNPPSRVRKIALLGALLAVTGTLAAEDVSARFAEADWFERPVGEGVVWRFHHFEDLFASRQSVSIIEVDLSAPGVEIEFPHHAEKLERTSSMTRTQVPAAVAAINATFFRREGGSITYVRIDGVTVNEQLNDGWHIAGAIGRRDDGRLAVLPVPPERNWEIVEGFSDLLANGPVLLTDGEIASHDWPEGHCRTRHPRTIVGLNEETEKLFLVTVDGRSTEAAGMTCHELSEVLLALGATDGLNMDGGGTTTMWVRDFPLHGGVVNFPSDNGQYDRAGERVSPNAIAVVARPPEAPLPWDGVVESVSLPRIMQTGASAPMAVAIRNLGTETWGDDTVALRRSRPMGSASTFAGPDWLSPDRPVAMQPPAVEPGEVALFRFDLHAPDVEEPTAFREFFALYRNGARFGPSDSEVRLALTVEPPFPPGPPGEIVIESTADGSNAARFVGDGWSPTPASVSAPGTVGSGSSYASTFRSVVGLREAFFEPNFPAAGTYKVEVAWPTAAHQRAPVTYTVRHGADPDDPQETRTLIDQTENANTWVPLGTFEFDAGESGFVRISNEDIDESGSMYAGAVRFTYLDPESAEDETMEERPAPSPAHPGDEDTHLLTP